MKIECRTLFDCSPTGTTGHFRRSDVPYQDQAGQEISDQTAWNHSRNQQRNWETLLQIAQLRSQIEIVHTPQRRQDGWYWQFSVEQDAVYGDDFVALYQDGDGVPMLTGLDETGDPGPVLVSSGRKQNIWFKTINN